MKTLIQLFSKFLGFIIELWEKMHLHHKLVVLLSFLGSACLLSIKWTIWIVILGCAVVFYIPFLTKDKIILKLIIPLSVIWIIMTILIKKI